MTARSFGFLAFLLLVFVTSRGAEAQAAHAASQAVLDAAVHQHAAGPEPYMHRPGG